ncbi:hypothetical protein GCM10020366_06930 [Saccharopolyspora gregorii]|uniref:Uncharacterized protein n=1 Tax=Saccharopolyspora gregorii TaxID=33914 RepID=A0ABP6RJM4_9PSEU
MLLAFGSLRRSRSAATSRRRAPVHSPSSAGNAVTQTALFNVSPSGFVHGRSAVNTTAATSTQPAARHRARVSNAANA